MRSQKGGWRDEENSATPTKGSGCSETLGGKRVEAFLNGKYKKVRKKRHEGLDRGGINEEATILSPPRGSVESAYKGTSLGLGGPGGQDKVSGGNVCERCPGKKSEEPPIETLQFNQGCSQKEERGYREGFFVTKTQAVGSIWRKKQINVNKKHKKNNLGGRPAKIVIPTI